MIWENPWAWLGLAGIALPVVIHLLARGQARIQRFPSVRFFVASRLLPTRRTRLHDLLLLVIRIAIIAAAVAAAARPLIVTPRRSHALGAPLARAIIVDTSASMRRPTLTGESAFDAAHRIAATLRDSASTSVVLETAEPAGAIAGAAAWLLGQPWRGELDVVSDFQAGTIDSITLSAVPRRLGIRLSRVGVRRDTVVDVPMRVGNANVIAESTPRGAETEVRWARRGAAPTSRLVTPVAGTDASARVAAAEHAGAAIGVRLPIDTSRSIEILYPDAPTAAAVMHGATMPHAPWMTTLVARLRDDSLLIDAAVQAETQCHSERSEESCVPREKQDIPRRFGLPDDVGLVVVRTASGEPIVTAVQSSERREGLVLISRADAGSLVSAALIAAVTRAQSEAPAPAELDPSVLPDNVLASWQRAPAAADVARANGDEGPSDARWLWLLALVLLGLETVVRRRDSKREQAAIAAAPQGAERTRVA